MGSNTESIFFYGQSTFAVRLINLTDKTQKKKWKISSCELIQLTKLRGEDLKYSIQEVNQERNWKFLQFLLSSVSFSKDLLADRNMSFPNQFFKLKDSEKVGLGKEKCVLFIFRFGAVDNVFTKRTCPQIM